MAARDRLGGLSDQTVAAMVLMRAVYDLVLVESVGIGQSEADISFVADTVLQRSGSLYAIAAERN